jgi:hypothetical protein
MTRLPIDYKCNTLGNQPLNLELWKKNLPDK